MKFVSEEAAKAAREMERKFQLLPPEAGILFVSAEPQPEEGGKVREFIIRLGLSRQFEESTGRAIMKKVLEDELKKFKLFLGVYRGVSGASRDEGTTRPGPLPS